MLVFRLCLGLGLAVLVASSAGAIPVMVSVTSVDEFGNGASQSGQFEMTDPEENGTFVYDFDDLPGNVSSAGAWEITEWSGLLNPDPVISNSFSVKNLLAVTQTFTITLSTVTGPIGAPTTITGGSAQFGVTDTNGDGATLSTLGLGTS